MTGNAPDEFVVVMNSEEQYSIWPAAKAIPPGWRPLAKRGGRQECVDYVDAVWTDMRPRSLREVMDADTD